MVIAAGTRLGRYEIRAPLGKGGMGEVYLAEDTRLGRKVALKLLPSDLTKNEDRLRRFEQEARAASALNHPNIITIHEIGAEGDTHFIATEFIEGETLRCKLQTTQFEIEETLGIAAQIAAALDAAHRSGIVHRDIKPENVIVREDGLVKVLDFGLAKLAEQKTVDVESEAATRVKTEAGMILGTVAYMSPEQARGREVDARTDIFSLGVVAYEMLAGRLPFAGETTSDVLASILKSEPEPLSQSSSGVPKELEKIVGKTLRKNRDERYQHIKDLLIDLRDLKQDLEFEAKLERTHTSTKAMVDKAAAATIQSAQTTSSAEYLLGEIKNHRPAVIAALLALTVGIAAFYFFTRGNVLNKQTGNELIDSIAVLPFANAAQDPNAEYLSDGITESVINRLSQLSGLKVMSRGSVFRYKGKEQDAQKVGNELNVRAVLTGSVKQIGAQLVINVSLDDAKDNHRIWGEQYVRQFADVLAVQSEIARDVSQKLRARLSGADEQKLAKNYTANTEAYQLYLKGRYHLLKTTGSEIQTGISYFQQAIAIDPSYALAYAGLADAYRAMTLGGEMPSTEFLPKAKAAAQKAVELDDDLAEAHAVLAAIILRYDWNWNVAENLFKRALELNPNSADTHQFYGNLLSQTGRHAEALAEIKRARELDPLNMRINALEGQTLIFAGRPDEALARLQKTFELDPNYWFAHNFASSAYIEKGMFSEAVAEARKAKDFSGGNYHGMAFEGYALAKSGKRAEARAVLEELLKLSTERYVPPYHVALIYNGLNERDEALTWLERGIEQRDPRMTSLKVEPKWNNLRDDPRFQDLLRRVGFTP